MEGVRYGQTERTKRGVTGCDREYDDSDEGDGTSDRTESPHTYHSDDAGRGNLLQSAVHLLEVGEGPVFAHLHHDAALVHAELDEHHRTGGPDHRDEALDDHHIIEGHAPVVLALDCPRDEGRLCGVEAGEDSAGHGHKENGNEVLCFEIISVLKRAGVPRLPDIYQRIMEDRHGGEYSHGGENENCAEDRVDTADDLVDREYRRNEIIDKNQ